MKAETIAQVIRETSERGFIVDASEIPRDMVIDMPHVRAETLRALWEIALQLAIMNERKA